MDQIRLNGLSLFAKHGVFDAEAELGQRFFIDVAISADISAVEDSDDPDKTIDWADLVEVTSEAFMVRRFKLIEAAAGSIVSAIFARFSAARSVRVEVRKPSAPIEAIFAYTSVVIERTREEEGRSYRS